MNEEKCKGCGIEVTVIDSMYYKDASRHPVDGPQCLSRQLATANARVAELEGVVAKLWRPMSDAPRGGTEVLLEVEWRAGIHGKMLVGHWMSGGHCIEDHPAIDEGWYFWNGCFFDRAAKPVAWMPLPDSKAAEAAQKGQP